jgi:hypothetical protein
VELTSNPERRSTEKIRGNAMESFTLVGKARTVFRLIELKAQREQAAKKSAKNNRNKRKPG